MTAAPEVEVLADAGAVAAAASEGIVSLLGAAEGSAPVHIGFTGGGVGIATIGALSRHPGFSGDLAARLHVWFSDERFVGSASQDRNDVQAAEAWGPDFPVPPENIHRVAGAEGEPDESAAARAAADYESEWLEQSGIRDDAPGSFDLVLLGMGPDAHVASLFPGLPGVLDERAGVIPVFGSPKPPPIRVSFTMPLIRSAQRVWIVAAGEGKADAVALAAKAGVTPSEAPASAARGQRETRWFLDEASASKLPGR